MRCDVYGDASDPRTRCILTRDHDGQHYCPDWPTRKEELELEREKRELKRESERLARDIRASMRLALLGAALSIVALILALLRIGIGVLDQ